MKKRRKEGGLERVVLLAVTGMSPGVLTETVWALAHSRPSVIPDKVIVVTTRIGRERLRQDLLMGVGKGGKSVWESLREALEREGMSVGGRLEFGDTGEHLRVFVGRDGRGGVRELESVTSGEDNLAVADFLLDQVRSVVEIPETRLIASIAGGYKTMSALLYASISLIGRPTDRITHVLVNDPFDKSLSPSFYFPKQPERKLEAGGRRVDARRARIALADLPFVALRELFPQQLGGLPRRFTELVARANRTIETAGVKQLQIRLYREQTVIEVNAQRSVHSPSAHLLLLFLATNARSQKGYSCYKDAVDDLQAFARGIKAERSQTNFGDWRDKIEEPSSYDERAIIRPLSDLKKRWSHSPMRELAKLLPVKGRCTLDLSASQIQIL